ncbi:MAG: hypothetical protein M3425_05140 [Actinomycetota bacterium]|nr:hypothetical protein [Actinomycetota bacterium]
MKEVALCAPAELPDQGADVGLTHRWKVGGGAVHEGHQATRDAVIEIDLIGRPQLGGDQQAARRLAALGQRHPPSEIKIPAPRRGSPVDDAGRRVSRRRG